MQEGEWGGRRDGWHDKERRRVGTRCLCRPWCTLDGTGGGRRVLWRPAGLAFEMLLRTQRAELAYRRRCVMAVCGGVEEGAPRRRPPRHHFDHPVKRHMHSSLCVPFYPLPQEGGGSTRHTHQLIITALATARVEYPSLRGNAKAHKTDHDKQHAGRARLCVGCLQLLQPVPGLGAAPRWPG